MTTDFRIPSDLIRRVQLSLREDAGLSSYDPHDPTLPPLPSVRESVAGFDPSLMYLRCKHCQGRLLRGLQSVICVYCGRRQSKDVPPDPLTFKSAFGYQWLLQSLDLDGSEVVGPSIEENEPYRGQSTSNHEISLSDLLKLEIPWPAESQKTEYSLTDDVPVQSKSSLNLDGVDMDNFFVESRRDLASNSSEEPVTNKQSGDVGIHTFSSKENLSLFQNVTHSSTEVSSSEIKDDNGFSGWEADFQSADSGNQHEVSRSFDPFVGSAVDFSAHMDSVFGPGKNLEDEIPKDTSTPFALSTTEWIQNDPGNNSNFLAPHEAQLVDASIKNKDEVAADTLYTQSSTSIDWFPDDQWQTNSMPAPENNTVSEADDSFDVWNDFTSSTSAQDPSKNSLTQNSHQIAAVDDQTSTKIFSSSTNNFQEMDFGSFSQPDLFSGSFSNQNSSVEANNLQAGVPASDRMAAVEVGGDVGQAAKDGETFNSATETEHDVESLLSQMHDLSFMLKSDLSVPSK